MANPQPDKFVKISTEIMVCLCRFRIPGEERQVMDTVMRQTYGWHCKAAAISLERFCELTGMAKPNICRALSKLITHNIIKSDNGQYSLQKDYERWLPFGIIKTDNAEKAETVIKSDNKPLSKRTMAVIKSDKALHINLKIISKDTSIDRVPAALKLYWPYYLTECDFKPWLRRR